MRPSQSAFLLCFAISAVAFGENRTFDGSGNNLAHPDWGAAEANFLRRADAIYDARSNPVGRRLPNPRVISNALFDQNELHPSTGRLSGYVYAFGQFISHDIQETLSGNTEDLSFRIPADDPFFGPSTFPLSRSQFDPDTGRGRSNPRQQINFTSAFIDASVVYSPVDELASILRGGPANPAARLRTSDDINGDGENLLPRDGFGPILSRDFVAGDGRVNDNVVLSSIHTVFLREHNRLVDELAIAHPDWDDEQLYQRARKFVGAQLQAITYNEFLPALLGPTAPALRGTYDPDVNAGVLNEFATTFLRLGHSMLTPDFKRVEDNGTVHPSIDLAAAFFNPAFLDTNAELELLLKGLSTETQEQVDLHLVDGMRFAALGAIDLQRARDHGLAGYNAMREAFGLPRADTFAAISSDPVVQRQLEEVYEDVDLVEAFVGALAEDHIPDGNVGALTAAVYVDQFTRLRDGDRFWYSNDSDFSVADRELIEATTLRDIIQRNTGLTTLQPNLFFIVPPSELDCNGDGLFDVADLACANEAGITDRLRELLGLKLGDLNGDGSVSFSDFGILSSHFGESLNDYTKGDLTGDGLINLEDFALLRANYQATRAASVPEPTTCPWAILLAGFAVCCRRSRQRKTDRPLPH